ncbi:MAG: CPBP family glutamic-type intramembrane protease, partial [Verrucomicrobiota bacterium]
AYRLCAALIILRLTKRKWLAILIPSILYAFAHSDLPFLPPQHPFLFKLLSSVALGCFWGFVYFRFGFLAVVIAHYFCDLTLVFYFFQSRPSSYPLGVAVMVAILAVPMIVRFTRRPTK